LRNSRSAFIGIIELPSLPERPAGRRMQRLGQMLDHVAGFMNMNLAALNRRVGAEGATDDFAYRLGAVDDEQPADLGIKPALSEGAHPRRFCRSLDSRAARLSCHGSPSVSLNFGIPEVASILLAQALKPRPARVCRHRRCGDREVGKGGIREREH
jgi:hypothetical protein